MLSRGREGEVESEISSVTTASAKEGMFYHVFVYYFRREGYVFIGVG